MIVAKGLQPGERLLTEGELITRYGCSKGTVREALSALEAEGLLVNRTGPGGGAYLAETDMFQAARGLRNFLHFQSLDSQQIYELRKVVEVELAVSAVGHIDESTLGRMSRNVAMCTHAPESLDEQWQQRVAELEFHNMLAASSPNPLLSFTGRFLNDLLRDLVRMKNTLDPERQQFGDSNCHYHQLLLDAYRREDSSAVRELMAAHMGDAKDHMRILEAEVANRFLLDFKTGGDFNDFVTDGLVGEPAS